MEEAFPPTLPTTFQTEAKGLSTTEPDCMHIDLPPHSSRRNLAVDPLSSYPHYWLYLHAMAMVDPVAFLQKQEKGWLMNKLHG